ncbi:MAG: hypothetical protein NEA02_12625, partial [Thermoanaerobaculia bacterium]|nr:hypothetical protein [Thermoanaerobaculia bacterium]
ASDQKRPSASQASTVAQQAGKLAIQTPFKVWPDGNWIFVVNYGTSDWTGALDVWATCKPVAPTTSCGPNFVGGKYPAGHYDKGTFPTGYGQAPIKGSANAQQVSGYGWVAVGMGLPAGKYRITATAANNTSPETDVTIAGSPSGNVVKVGPGTLQLSPTKTP